MTEPSDTLAAGEVVSALIPLVVGILAAFVAYGRWRPALQTAALTKT